MTQLIIYDGAFILKIGSRYKYTHKRAPLYIFSWVLNKPILFEDSKRFISFILHYKTLK